MEEKTKNEKTKNFFINVLKGAVMGIACIIPGFSGGTVAVVLGIYNGFIEAIAGLFKHFKKSFFYLLPFIIGIVIGFAGMIVPINLGFEFLPLPIICLFVGLMLGGMPPIIKDAGGDPKPAHIRALILAAAFAVGICFIPRGNADMTDAGFPQYLSLSGVGVLASVGSIVPGISGSMICMIFGAYDLVLGTLNNIVTFNFATIGSDLLILLSFGIGMIIGFFSVAFLMRFLLRKFRKGTYYAIIGFVIGSVFSIYYKQHTGDGLINPALLLPLQIVLAVMLFAIGFVATYVFCKVFDGKKDKAKEKENEEKQEPTAQDVD